MAAGLSPAVGTRWFRQSGGMQPFTFVPLSGRYLSFAEREEIAVLNAQHIGVRAIARQLGRSPSTISRELRRNAATRGGNLEYRATNAQWHADRRAKRPKVSKLAANDSLREYVQDRLAGEIARPDGELVSARMCVGSDGATAAGKTVAGRSRGVPNRSPTASGSISPMMSPCGSPTKRIYQALYVQGTRGLSNANWRRACELGGHYESPEHGPRGEERDSSLPKS